MEAALFDSLSCWIATFNFASSAFEEKCKAITEIIKHVETYKSAKRRDADLLKDVTWFLRKLVNVPKFRTNPGFCERFSLYNLEDAATVSKLPSGLAEINYRYQTNKAFAYIFYQFMCFSGVRHTWEAPNLDEFLAHEAAKPAEPARAVAAASVGGDVAAAIAAMDAMALASAESHRARLIDRGVTHATALTLQHKSGQMVTGLLAQTADAAEMQARYQQQQQELARAGETEQAQQWARIHAATAAVSPDIKPGAVAGSGPTFFSQAASSSPQKRSTVIIPVDHEALPYGVEYVPGMAGMSFAPTTK